MSVKSISQKGPRLFGHIIKVLYSVQDGSFLSIAAP